MKVQGSSPQGGAQGVERGQDGAKGADARVKKEREESPFERMMRGEPPPDEEGTRSGARADEGSARADEGALEEGEGLDELDGELDDELAPDEGAPDGARALQ